MSLKDHILPQSNDNEKCWVMALFKYCNKIKMYTYCVALNLWKAYSDV